MHAKVVLAVGRGAMLDFAKAVACMVPLRGASPGRTGRAGLLRTEQFLLQTGGEMSREAATLLPGEEDDAFGSCEEVAQVGLYSPFQQAWKRTFWPRKENDLPLITKRGLSTSMMAISICTACSVI